MPQGENDAVATSEPEAATPESGVPRHAPPSYQRRLKVIVVVIVVGRQATHQVPEERRFLWVRSQEAATVTAHNYSRGWRPREVNAKSAGVGDAREESSRLSLARRRLALGTDGTSASVHYDEPSLIRFNPSAPSALSMCSQH